MAPSATSGVPFISQGASADPIFGTAVVAGGGTGATSFSDNNSVVLTGATGTSALVSLTTGASGKVLTSNGAGVAPSWETNAGGNVSGPGSSTDRAISHLEWNGRQYPL